MAKSRVIPPPPAEADDADLAGAVGALLEVFRGCEHVLAGFGLVEGGEEFAGFVLIAGVAAQRGEGVGGEGQVAFQGQAAGNVLDMGG